jgi:hypothetical protein
MSQGERDYGALRELETKIERFQRAPAHTRRDGLTITEEEAKIVRPLVEREQRQEIVRRRYEGG